MAIAHASGFFLTALLALGAGLSPAAEFVAEFKSMQDLDAAFTKSSWAGENRTHSAANVDVKDGILELKLSGSQPGSLPVCAEIVSRKSDFLYGTYRASIKMTSKPGAVVGWFIYRGSPLNEIDIEFLTRNPRTAYFTLHHVETSVDHATRALAFDPSAAFHEYRFDWHAGKVDYYIDNQFLVSLTNKVPDSASALLLNHWSGNIPGWGGAAPTEDVFMYVDWAYYNSDYSAPRFLPVEVQPIRARKPMSKAGWESRFVRDENQILFLRSRNVFSLSGKILP